MPEEKNLQRENSPDSSNSEIHEKKPFGADLEDELTPISVRQLFDRKKKKRRDNAIPEKIQEEKKAPPSPAEPKATAPVEPEPKKAAPPAEKKEETPKPEEKKPTQIEDEELYDPDIDGVFLDLIDEYMPRSEPAEIGEVMEVPVLEIRPDCVLVDVGDKTEGMVDIAELMTRGGDVKVSPGDLVEVMIEGRDEDSDQVILSHRKAVRKMAVERLKRSFEEKTPIRGRVSFVVKGGLIVDIGLPCFMPASHIDTSRVENLDAWVGKEVEAYVIDFNMERRRAVISRRLLIREDLEKRKKALLDNLKEGILTTVTVKSIHDFGAFADMGPMDGFIPREEVSHERSAHPSMFLREGQEIKVKVIKVDRENGKISISRKQARVDPWIRVKEKYPVNTMVTGAVVSITNYGAFVQIEEGLTGMIHVSNMSWEKIPKRADEFLKQGDIVKAVVLKLDMENRKMALGLKQITEDPWIAVEGKFGPGLKVKGTVTKLTDFGAFVKLDDNIEGLVHISNMTWDKTPLKPDHYLKVGEEVEAVILRTSREGRRISLGLKQLQKSPMQKFLQTHKIGHTVEGVITRLASFGAFVDLGSGVEGLIHVSQISPTRVENPSSVLKEGEKVKCKITKISAGGRKIGLSRKEVIIEEEKKAVSQYLKSEVKGGVNIGDLIKDMKIKMK